MQVIETSADGLRREFKIVLPAAEVEEKIQGRLSELSRRMQLKGFRPGKVPLTVLKQRFGREVLGEVVEQAVTDSSARVMSDRGIRAAGQPKIEILPRANDGDLEYKLAVELVPEVKPMDFSGLEFERLVVEVPDQDIDQAIEKMAQRLRKSEPVAVSRPGKTGDILVIDFVGRVDGVEFPGGTATGHFLELGSGSLIPGFEDQLVGADVGERREVNVKFPADYPNESLAGKDAVFEVNVREVREPVAVAINDEMAKSLGAEDLAALRNTVRERIGADYGAVTRGHLKRQLLDVLAANHHFEMPVGLVESEFDTIWRQIEADRAQGRLDPDDANKSDDDLKREYRDIAVRRVKLGLLLSEVGRLNNIEVANEELSRAIVNEARRHPGQERKVIEYYQKSPQAAVQLRAPLYEDKVVDFILELAKVTERKLRPDELAKALEEGRPPTA